MYLEIRNYFDKEIENFWKKQEYVQNFNLFQSYDWNSKVLEKFFNDQKYELQILVIKEKDIVIAVLPFFKKKQFTLQKLLIIGEGLTDYSSLIFQDKILNDTKKLEEIFLKLKSINNEFDLIHFRNQLNNKSFYPLNPFFNLLNFEKKQKVYGIEISNTWEEYIINNNLTKLEKKINYYQRKLNIDINKDFQIITKNSQKKEVIKQTLHNKKKFSTLYNHEKLEEFFLDSKILDKLHCSAIYDKKNEILASNIGILEKKKFIYYFPSYTLSKEIKKYSPGSILLYCLIKFFFKNKISFFDFGLGNEEYKKKWSNIFFDSYEYLYAHTFKGKLYKTIKNFY